MATKKRAPLSRERVLSAALTIVDREGLDALSMRRVGLELGVEAMSLYNHVPSKASLLDGLYERILDEMERPAGARTWTAYAGHQAKALRKVLLRHPNAATLFATRPATTSASLERLETYLGVLGAAGFSAIEALEIVQCVSAFVVGHTLWSVRAVSDPDAPDYDGLDAERFAHVRAAVAALDEGQAEREFERGLDALLRGLASK